ncbi:MAG TPA: CinA family protein [Nitrospirae bacterium]|nr:CinA family protein [Nitrospirota bacterium]
MDPDEINGLAIAERVRDLFTGRGLKLALAESVTGGLIASTLTSAPGASEYFHSSIVSYSPDAKQRFLGVDPGLPEGIVSADCARKMAEGALRATGADVVLSTTGNAGPEVLEEKPVGLVFAAVATREKTFALRLELKGNRNEIRQAATASALELLIREVGR